MLTPPVGQTAPGATAEHGIGQGVIGVIRTSTAARALTLARGLALTDVVGIEVTMTVPGAVDVIGTLVGEGVTRVGAGTVRSRGQVHECIDAGATFIVSPHLDLTVVDATIEAGVLVIPGVLTPSEILAAHDAGAWAVKLFPVSAVGGVDYVRALRQPIPDVRLVVSGEVTLPEVDSYLAAGAWAACVGTSLWRVTDVDSGDVDAVAEYARRVMGQATWTRENDGPTGPT